MECGCLFFFACESPASAQADEASQDTVVGARGCTHWRAHHTGGICWGACPGWALRGHLPHKAPDAACKPSSQSLGYPGTPRRSEGWGRAVKPGCPSASSSSALLAPFISLSPGSPRVAGKSGAAFLIDEQNKPCSQKERGGWLGLLGSPPPAPGPGCRHLSCSTQLAPYILRGSKGAAKPLWVRLPQLGALALGRWVRGMLGWL